jgi:hypothetical protein
MLAPLFIDFEASGFGPRGYPIQVGWATPDGSSEARLIRPSAAWLDAHWDERAERVHGISRERLIEEGEPSTTVISSLAAAARGRRLYANDVGHDERWLNQLLRAAGTVASDEWKVWCANILFRQLAAERNVTLSAIEAEARRLSPVTHQAADDARYLATIYLLLSDRS